MPLTVDSGQRQATATWDSGGDVNLLNRAYGGVAPGVRVASVGANVAMTVFAVVAGLIGRASPGSFAIIVGLVGGTTVLSLIRRSSSLRAA